jgi:geranylgeranyl transferase type-1 subunit beta
MYIIFFFDKDVMHTYFGIAGLSLMNESGFFELDPAINISKRAKENLLNNCVFRKKINNINI